MQILCNNAVWEDKGLLKEKPLNVDFTQSDTLLSALLACRLLQVTVGWNKIQLPITVSLLTASLSIVRHYLH